MVCKIGFKKWNAKIALLLASMVVTYHIKLFRAGADRHNNILMSLLLLVVETITSTIKPKCKVRLRFNAFQTYRVAHKNVPIFLWQ